MDFSFGLWRQRVVQEIGDGWFRTRCNFHGGDAIGFHARKALFIDGFGKAPLAIRRMSSDRLNVSAVVFGTVVPPDTIRDLLLVG